MAKYTVIEQFHGAGRMNRVGDEIELTDEAAATLAGFIRPSDGSAKSISLANAQKVAAEIGTDALVTRIDALLTENKELKAEHEAVVADLTNQIDELTTQRVELLNDLDVLKAENEQLKAAAAKPAAKGK
ncbi:MAG: hypothetical protein FIA89_09030 [Geobacter sp.]|nr:hypothetical protein [Geobacter sp.]